MANRKFKISIKKNKMLMESSTPSKTFVFEGKGVEKKAAELQAKGFDVLVESNKLSVSVPFAQRDNFISTVVAAKLPNYKVAIAEAAEDEEDWDEEKKFDEAVSLGEEAEDEEVDEDAGGPGTDDPEEHLAESDDEDEDDEMNEADDEEEVDEEAEDAVDEDSENIVDNTPGVEELNQEVDLEDPQNTEAVEDGTKDTVDESEEEDEVDEELEDAVDEDAGGPGTDDPEDHLAEAEDEIDSSDYDEEEANENIRVLMKAVGVDESAFDEIKTIFQAAVANETKSIRADYKKAFEKKLERALARERVFMRESLNTYATEVVNKFVKKHSVALESVVRTQQTEKIVSEMFNVLRANNIEVPKGKTDAFATLTESHKELKRAYDRLAKENAALNEAANVAKIQKTVAKLTEGLSDLEKDKFDTMLEGFEFESVEDFEKKATLIKESFYASKKPKVKFVRESETGAQTTNESSALNVGGGSAGSEMDLYLGALKTLNVR